jgi:hypothetical protein
MPPADSLFSVRCRHLSHTLLPLLLLLLLLLLCPPDGCGDDY